jgi:hypothetical protein
MSRASQLTSGLGLLLTILGSGLLYLYANPKMKVGNILVQGNLAVRVEGKPHVADDPVLWQSRATPFLERAARWNRNGFGLVAIGSLLQFTALWL